MVCHRTNCVVVLAEQKFFTTDYTINTRLLDLEVICNSNLEHETKLDLAICSLIMYLGGMLQPFGTELFQMPICLFQDLFLFIINHRDN
jgi:hypothetical protein